MKNRTLYLIVIIVVAFAAVFLLDRHFAKQNISNVLTTPTPAATLANPASVNCEKKGGTTVIKTNGGGGQYGLCQFPDNMACEEWAMMRGDCPVGGIKTTGYDNIQQMYCAWAGGQTYAVENATCTLPGGKVCSDDSYYNGTCPTYGN